MSPARYLLLFAAFLTELLSPSARGDAIVVSQAMFASTIAEYFRDEGRDVLMFIDNIYRYTLAGTEVSALLGRMPSAVGYQPTLATEMGELQERITSTTKGSITSVQAVYVPADDLTDPSATHIFAHLSASIVLSRKRASQGLYPAIDPLASSSTLQDPLIVGQRHYHVAEEVRRRIRRRCVRRGGREEIGGQGGAHVRGPAHKRRAIADQHVAAGGAGIELVLELDAAQQLGFAAVLEAGEIGRQGGAEGFQVCGGDQ